MKKCEVAERVLGIGVHLTVCNEHGCPWPYPIKDKCPMGVLEERIEALEKKIERHEEAIDNLDGWCTR